MSRVLARRDDNWRKLQQYILDERERATLTGPAGLRLFGLDREYVWYIRDGVFVRSPVRFDGVTLGEADRRTYEDEWLERERKREEKQRGAGGEVALAGEPAGDADVLNQLARQPQFVSAAYFLKFKFEPGRYAYAGPDTYEGRQVHKIEYYPARLFSEDTEDGREARVDAAAPRKSDEEARREREMEERLNRQFNKVALVTLWVEPGDHQIVRYDFENVGLDFLPGRSLVRVDDIAASMQMSQPFPGVWLPRRIDGGGAVTLASGTFALRYSVEYHDYREAATGARIR